MFMDDGVTWVSVNQVHDKLTELTRFREQARLISRTGGNLSARICGDGGIFISSPGPQRHGSPSACQFNIDGSIIDLSGKPPHSITLLHVQIYYQRPDVRSIVFGKLHYADIVGRTWGQVPDLVKGDIPDGNYVCAPSNNDSHLDLVDVSAQIIPRLIVTSQTIYTTFTVPGSGTLAIGTTIEEAYHRLQVIESLSKAAVCQIMFDGVCRA